MQARARIFGALGAICLAVPLAAQNTFRQAESRVDVGDWSPERYLRSNGTPEACQAYHRVLMNNATEVALVAAFAIPEEGPGVLYQISVPLGIELIAGVLLAVDADYSVNLPATRRTLQGCLLEGRLTDAPFQAIMAGSLGTLTVQIPGQGPLPIPMSLDGLADSIRRIDEATRPEPADVTPQDSIVPPQDDEEPPEPLDTDLNPSGLSSDQTNEIDPTLAPVTGATSSNN